ncbi:MAG: hypothetical protein COU85_00050 [Candidatus Portnoybacteria bacterium CG10_big_fil_rev_8_21_14_0_10_44_7]|uniref:Radical SAM core domain-containing protein n=1 Tax=Candidatus Portnoybacteria bacterium CG10_big_fil_rev_8_21_14_0_10_44_7 TaxID=1974816 RepID=A0A2M8KJK7_9BACT|nr:MAG: hypothetical protein COU85_00050 [Candidatus Portnoybacteria bacterium CG10_big_fil_rev_8_21_14_0_10_44_7]
MKEDKIKKTVVIVGYRCNNSCVFCIDQEKRALPEKNLPEILGDIETARAGGATYLELIGGEITIRPELLAAIKHAKKLGFDTIAMATNGRMFAYPDVADKFLRAGLNSVIFSIHGHTAKLHDRLTQSPGSFRQLLAGLQNVKKKLGLARLASNTTIVKQNYRVLPQIGEFIGQKLGIRNSEFIFVDPTTGGARIDFFQLVPKISIAAPYIKKCLDIGRELRAPHWHVRYVPLCYFVDYLDQISELHEVRLFQTQHLAPDYVNFDVEGSRPVVGRVKPPKCRGCLLFKNCEGLWKEYYRHYGGGELCPQKTLTK